MSEIRDILTIAEAAEEWGRSEQSISKALRRGTLRGRKVGRPYFQVWITTREAMAEYVARISSTKEENRQRWENMVRRREARERAADRRWLADQQKYRDDLREELRAQGVPVREAS